MEDENGEGEEGQCGDAAEKMRRVAGLGSGGRFHC